MTISPTKYDLVINLKTPVDYPRTTVITDSPHVRMTLVRTGGFLSIFPASALRFPAERPKINQLPVQPPLACVPVDIVTLKNRTLGLVARLFIDSARDVAKPLMRSRV
jgi:hypothetical protein